MCLVCTPCAIHKLCTFYLLIIHAHPYILIHRVLPRASDVLGDCRSLPTFRSRSTTYKPPRREVQTPWKPSTYPPCPTQRTTALLAVVTPPRYASLTCLPSHLIKSYYPIQPVSRVASDGLISRTRSSQTSSAIADVEIDHIRAVSKVFTISLRPCPTE